MLPILLQHGFVQFPCAACLLSTDSLHPPTLALAVVQTILNTLNGTFSITYTPSATFGEENQAQ